MKNFPKYFIGLLFLILLSNAFSVFCDKELFKDLTDINRSEVVLISTVEINEVFSNSFFFIASDPPKKIDTNYLYRLDNQNTGDIIYFKVNTIKFKDSLFFFQHIDWVSKRSRKIEKGFYSLSKILSDEKE